MVDKRLIDANALMKNIGKIPQLRGITYGRMKKAVEETPTIDAVSVVHGRWILERIYRKCSLCEWIFCIRDEEGDLQKFNYCPNCGMPMDGGADK